MPEIPAELDDQLALVTEIRRTLFPDKIDSTTGAILPLHDARKAMLFTKHIAWRLRHLGIGLVRAKVGSENNVDGFTTDIVALPSGDHWDVQVDGHNGAALPRWAKEENPENNIPIRERWVPAVDPGGVTPAPVPDPITPKPDPSANDVDLRALISEAIAPLTAEIARLRDEVSRQKAASQVSLKSTHGKYLSASPDGTLTADRDAPGPWETFDVEERT